MAYSICATLLLLELYRKPHSMTTNHMLQGLYAAFGIIAETTANLRLINDMNEVFV